MAAKRFTSTPGAHLLVRDVVLSGQSNLGAHEGVIITGPTDPSKVASFTRGNAGAANAVFEINAGDFVTLAHLTLLGSTVRRVGPQRQHVVHGLVPDGRRQRTRTGSVSKPTPPASAVDHLTGPPAPAETASSY